MKITDLQITVDEIIPPLSGGLKYAAKVGLLNIEDHLGRRKVNHIFGEHWGTTRDEAREKVNSAVQKWLASQNAECS